MNMSHTPSLCVERGRTMQDQLSTCSLLHYHQLFFHFGLKIGLRDQEHVQIVTLHMYCIDGEIQTCPSTSLCVCVCNGGESLLDSHWHICKLCYIELAWEH